MSRIIRTAQTASFDVTVVGGGMAGVCAAIAAARHGAKTALIQDRSVLGGNSSSEMRVWTVGATAMGRNRYAAETGIMGELDLENLYRNPEGNPHIWDSILLNFVMQEKNLTLYLNTTVLDTDGTDTHLESIRAYQMSTETWLEIKSDFFIDCTGDGSLSVSAGVPYMQGREARERFGESLAPDAEDAFTLGNTLLLYSRDAGKPVAYHAPDFAYDIDYIHNLIVGNEKPLELHTSGCDFWWLETGGSSDTIKDGETIRFELQKLVYGIWNYIKNSGRFEADNLELEWVGSLPAKRESRRLEGAYVLTQNDILEHRDFPDAVCSGGWPIDTHPPGGIYSKKEACEQRDAGVYQIPLRCLYAKYVDNLFFAGRNISASHLAFASTRVMKTCAVMGQAAGTAAALCKRWNKVPRALSATEVSDIQRTLLWDDQWIPNENVVLKNQWTPLMQVEASGCSGFENNAVQKLHRLDEELWIMLPRIPGGNTLRFWMCADKAGTYQAEYLCGTRHHACNDMISLGTETVCLEETPRWVEFKFDFEIPQNQDLFLRMSAAAGAIGVSDTPVCGCVGSVGKRTGLRLVNPCFQIENVPKLFAPCQVQTAFSRPTNTPNLWMSAPLSEGPAWLECTLPNTNTEKQMQILFDTDLNRDYNQLKPDYYGNGWQVMPAGLAKDFRILTDDGTGAWECLAEYRNHHQRCCRFLVGENVKRIRIEFFSTWGAPCVGVYAVQLREEESL